MNKKIAGPALLVALTAFGMAARAESPFAAKKTATTSTPWERKLPQRRPAPVAAAADAARFVAKANEDDSNSYPEITAAQWVGETYITDDTQLINAKAGERWLGLQSQQIDGAKRFNGVAGLAPDVARQLQLIKTSSALPPPSDPRRRQELSQLGTKLDAEYGAGKYCPPGGGECRNLDQLEAILDHSRDPKELADAWAGWHSIARPMKADYARFVDLMNVGARELGYADTGELWRAGYDMPPAQFAAETERLWDQVSPLYTQLHCYVRGRLHQKYGDLVPENGLIPADLLGNMWAQQWGNIYDLVEPYPGVGSVDISAVLKKRRDDLRQTMLADFRDRYAKAHPDQTPDVQELADAERAADDAFAKDTAKIAEDFYTSLGFPALPASFYEKSMLARPRDRDAVCHASAWDLNMHGDVRIKMCIRPDEESLFTIHHELGHIYYFLMYNPQPFLYQAGANDGFHEAIGDTMTLSLTPQHLQKIGLASSVDNDERAVVNAQMRRALEKIAFLPFGKLIDQWRWKVFAGEIKPADYNKGWWQLREKYQGIKAPVARSEEDFDPGAKYHIPGNTPYTRYFLSFILQFQFQKALCDAAGFKGPLYECDIYGSKAAGEKFMAMLKAGASQPWQDTLEELAGTRRMDASAIIEYFQPLMQYLQQQNAGHSCGWSEDDDPLENGGGQQALR
jgi:peptidyl-dipeptidase A